MKTLWKALGIAALATAIPVRVKQDEEKGKKTYQSLLLSVDVGPGANGEGTDIGVNFGEGVITGAIRNLLDSKNETKLFADDEPEAAVLDVDEMQDLAGEVQDVADKAQTLAGDVKDAAEEMADAAADFDPEF